MSNAGEKPKGVLALLLNYVPKSITITGDPAKDGLIFKVIGIVAASLATWLFSFLKLTDPAYLAYLTGGLTALFVIAATLVFGFINSRILQAKSMNAALNLQAAGESILVPAETVPTAPQWPGAIVNKPITPMTAQEIVKNFGDVTVPVSGEAALTAALNRSQLNV